MEEGLIEKNGDNAETFTVFIHFPSFMQPIINSWCSLEKCSSKRERLESQ